MGAGGGGNGCPRDGTGYHGGGTGFYRGFHWVPQGLHWVLWGPGMGAGGGRLGATGDNTGCYRDGTGCTIGVLRIVGMKLGTPGTPLGATGGSHWVLYGTAQGVVRDGSTQSPPRVPVPTLQLQVPPAPSLPPRASHLTSSWPADSEGEGGGTHGWGLAPRGGGDPTSSPQHSPMGVHLPPGWMGSPS